MNKRIFINILALLVSFSALAVKPNIQRNNKKRAPVATHNRKEIKQTTQATDNHSNDEQTEMPTFSESWNKVIRFKWTSLSKNDAWNIGASLVSCGIIAYLYNNVKCDVDAHNNEDRACRICFDEKKGYDFCTLSCCGHNTACVECLQEIIHASLQERKTTDIRCPNQNCAQAISRRDVSKILRNNPGMYKRYNDVVEQEWLNKNGIHCPTPDCTYTFIKKSGLKSLNCPQCKQIHCAKCLNKHPIKISCDKAAAGANDQWKKQNSKKCPQCKVDIQKNEGCNHMTCKCRHEFCWECLRRWKTCNCALFPAGQQNNPINGQQQVPQYFHGNVNNNVNDRLNNLFNLMQHLANNAQQNNQGNANPIQNIHHNNANNINHNHPAIGRQPGPIAH